MMTGVEIDLVVRDSLEALALYERIFAGALERVEVTAFPAGQNEAVFTLYGARFHMLDENPEYQLLTPREGEGKPVWFNVLVEDIRQVYGRAMEAGCAEVQPVTEMPAMGAANAMFTDRYGHLWLLHQMYSEVSFEDRVAAVEAQRGEQDMH